MATFINGVMVSIDSLTDEEIEQYLQDGYVPLGSEHTQPKVSHIQKRMTLPCAYLGEATGESKNCQTCGGAKDIPIYQCSVYGECTWKSMLITDTEQGRKQYQWCVTCHSYKDKEESTSLVQEVIKSNSQQSVTPVIEEPPVPIQWSYGVTTVWEDKYQRKMHTRRNDLLPRTLESLKNAGFDKPILFVDGCDGKTQLEYENKFGLHVETRRRNIATYANWFLAIQELYLRNPSAQRYAIFQDDFITYKNLRQYLEWSPYPYRGYLNLYTFPDNKRICPKKSGTNERITGWYPANQRGLGAVALIFNNEAIRALLTSWHMVDRCQGDRKDKAVDGGVVESMVRSGPSKYMEYVHNPSLTQHTGIVSSMGNGPQSESENFEKLGENFDALELIPRYNSDKVPVPPSSISLGGARPPRV